MSTAQHYEQFIRDAIGERIPGHLEHYVRAVADALARRDGVMAQDLRSMGVAQGIDRLLIDEALTQLDMHPRTDPVRREGPVAKSESSSNELLERIANTLERIESLVEQH